MKHPIPDRALDDRLAIIGTSGSGKTYTAKGCVERLLEKCHRVVVIDPLDVWFGLRLKVDGKTPAFDVAILGGRHGDMPLTENAGAVIGEAVATSNESCIVSLTGLRTSASRQRFMLGFLDALYERTDPDKRDPYHVVFDEADLWAPQKPMGNEAMLCHLMEEIVRRGRVKGFIPWLISQRPAVLNKNVLSQADGLIAMSLTSSQDRAAIDAWVEGQADRKQRDDVLSRLPALTQGYGIVWIPRQGIFTEVRFPENKTFDSSRTPKRGEKKHNAVIQPLNIDALKGKLAAVETEAKANDPAALKGKIADLQRQLAAKPAAPMKDDRAIELAKGRGYDQGVRDSAAWHAPALARVGTLVNQLGLVALADLPATIGKVAQELEAQLGVLNRQAAKGHPATAPLPESLQEFAPAPSREMHPPTAERVATTDHRAARATPSPGTGGDGDPSWLTGPQSRILNALASWRAMGNTSPVNAQVAWLAGYSPTSTSYTNPRSALKTKGLIHYPGQDQVALTEEGAAIARANPPQDIRTFVLQQLRGPERRILEALIERYPRAVSNEEAAAAAGYSHTSTSYTNPRSALRTKELLTYPDKGSARAADWLFP